MGEGFQSGQRVTVDEAARHLGLTVDAVRKRVQRGQIAHEKDRAGRVRIILDSNETLQDESPDTTGQADALIAAKDETIEELRGRVRRLEQELDTRNEEIRRRDHLLAAALDRIPELEAPQESPEDAEMVEEAPEGAEESRSEVGEVREELVAERALREMAETTLHEGMAEERRRREGAERERDDLRRELHARSRQQGAHETAEEQQGRGQGQSATGGTQEGARRPWWRRIIGG